MIFLLFFNLAMIDCIPKVLDFANNYSQSKTNSNSWNKSTEDLPFVQNDFEKEYGFKKKNITTNKSTLSLRIEARKSLKRINLSSKNVFKYSISFIQNPFEFPRQQESSEEKMPEISQYKASQKLLNQMDQSLPQDSHAAMAETSSNEPEVIFKDLSADDEDQVPMEIESLCMQCHKNGITKIMCIRIPYYKQVIVVSFLCDHCGFRNNGLQSGEAVQEFGTEIVLHAKTKEDLNRQVVKSEYASIEIPELDLVIPYNSQPGEITTVEGVLMRVKNGLEQDQDRRKREHPEAAEQIDQFISKLQSFASLEKPFTLKLNDPSGNCYIQSPNPLHVDPRCIVSHYYRKLSDNKILGLADDNDEEEDPEIVAEREWKSYEDVKQEVLRFHVDCPGCGAPTETCMKPTDIPYFKEVIIMSTSCDTCGFKSNEVQASGATQEYGCRLSCEISDELDLARDVLKCDTCNMEIPELELQVGYGALSSRFTTIEGLLQATREQLEEQSRFFMGDSAVDGNDGTNKRTIQNVLDGIDEILALKRKATIILDDCAGNSYIQSLMAPMDDPKLHKTFYKRTFEQNEELGLNDMKTENYGEMDAIEEGDEEEDVVKEDAATQEA